MTIARTPVDDGIALLTMDDGKANAFDLDFFAAMDETLDACADDAAIVIAGRDGMFSAGLNTKVIAAADDEAIADLLAVFGRTMLRIWLEPRPVVAAATGHAIAGGTILSMVTDHSVAAEGDFRWGLTETSIGFPIPRWVLAIARGNVPPHRLDDLVLPGALVGVDDAVEAGFADASAPPAEVVDAAVARARELAQLPRPAYAETKRRLRAAAAEGALAAMSADVTGLVAARASGP